MEAGAKGCEIVISGKLRAARAKSMKFTDGFMIHSGQPAVDFVDHAVRHVMLRQGVLGIKVKMYVLRTGAFKAFLLLFFYSMKDFEGQNGPQKPLPDYVEILPAQVDKDVPGPISEQKEPAYVPPPGPAEDTYQQPQREGYPDEEHGESAPPF